MIRDETSNHILDIFKKYLHDCNEFKRHNLCDIEWENRDYSEQRPIQNDFVNCGVYVMFYMHCLSQGIEMPSIF